MLFQEFFEAKDKVRNNPGLQEQLEGLRNAADKYLKTDIPSFKLSEFIDFYKTGIRKHYEIKYFERRGRLAAFALMLIFYNDLKYIEPLEDIIWAICDESTWVLPAHISENAYERNRIEIDLFCAETGFALSEIKYLLSDVLSERIKYRIHKEVDERIIKAYLNNTYPWETFEHNWSAVCAGSVGASFLYEATDDEINSVTDRLKASFDCYLNSYPKDGICLEGYAYWKYGFEFYIAYAELLRQYTSNKIDLFADERVRKIAEFQDVAILRPGRAISFSDVVSDELPNIGTTHFLYGKYGKLQTKNRVYEPYGYESCNRWQVMLRDFIWTQANKENPEIADNGFRFFPDAGWYIKKTPKYILCAKGGSNAESHNHNDAGSFFLDCGNQEILCDLGSGEYTCEYFGGGRYDYLVTSSRGHNLPVIDGQYQKPGSDKGAEIQRADESVFETELSSAYDLDGIDRIIRTIESEDNQITVSSKISSVGKEHIVAERLVSRIKPTLKDNTLYIGPIRIFFENAECTIKSENFSNHKWETETVYITDIIGKMSVSYKIEL